MFIAEHVVGMFIEIGLYLTDTEPKTVGTFLKHGVYTLSLRAAKSRYCALAAAAASVVPNGYFPRSALNRTHKNVEGRDRKLAGDISCSFILY